MMEERMSNTDNTTGPLQGLKVIDLSHVMAGPTCALMLADMGATVIKVEKVPGGDDTRRSVPPAIAGESAAFMMMNRNKRGIALDLKTEGGKAALRRQARALSGHQLVLPGAEHARLQQRQRIAGALLDPELAAIERVVGMDAAVDAEHERGDGVAGRKHGDLAGVLELGCVEVVGVAA